jgi:hypothetical protein
LGKLTVTNKEGKTRTADFNDNIKSIKIDGKCMVALYDNSFNGSSWDHNTPGSDSEVFFESDSNLTDNQIHSCHPVAGLGFLKTKSCASSIAIFPLR